MRNDDFAETREIAEKIGPKVNNVIQIVHILEEMSLIGTFPLLTSGIKVSRLETRHIGQIMRKDLQPLVPATSNNPEPILSSKRFMQALLKLKKNQKIRKFNRSRGRVSGGREAEDL